MERRTRVINLISGPGAGKTSVSAYLFYNLKIRGYCVEYVSEVAKQLVWTRDFETLNNQHYVSTQQYKLLKSLVGLVDFIITDGPLTGGLYYNRFNQDNTSNIDKTEQSILKWISEFDNINIFLDRGSIPYEKEGRYQEETEAKQIDTVLQLLMNKNSIPFAIFPSIDPEKILDYIIGQISLDNKEE